MSSKKNEIRIFVNDDAVPDDEYDDVRMILDEHGIRYRERPRLIGSFYRFGARKAGSDLVVDTYAEYERAREIIDDYQARRVQDARASYTENREMHRGRELVGWLLAAAVIGAVLWLSIRIGFVTAK